MPPAAAEKPAVKTVTEFVLRTGQGESQQGVFSHASEEVVRAKRSQLVIAAVESGQQSPDYELVKRVCKFPLDAEGKPQSRDSSVVETVL